MAASRSGILLQDLSIILAKLAKGLIVLLENVLSPGDCRPHPQGKGEGEHDGKKLSESHISKSTFCKELPETLLTPGNVSPTVRG